MFLSYNFTFKIKPVIYLKIFDNYKVKVARIDRGVKSKIKNPATKTGTFQGADHEFCL